MIHFSGDRQFPGPPAEVWPKLRDLGLLVQCIRGGQPSGPPPTQEQAQCTIRPNLPFARGPIIVTLRLVEAKEPTTLRIMVNGQGTNLTSEVETRLTLVEHQGGTRISWAADVLKLGGMLNVAPSGQVRDAAQKVVQEVWSLLSARLSR
jgi:carbon monoxide dehydrogenase subunit G